MALSPTFLMMAADLNAPRPEFAREAFSPDVWTELGPLISEHWLEVAPEYLADILADPDSQAYENVQATGALRLYTVRLRGELVGYLVAVVLRHQHHATSLQADIDVLYLAPTVRGHAATAFLRWVDEQLQAEGVEVVRHRVKVTRDWSALLARMGYQAEETIWSRRLD